MGQLQWDKLIGNEVAASNLIVSLHVQLVTPSGDCSSNTKQLVLYVYYNMGWWVSPSQTYIADRMLNFPRQNIHHK